MNQIRSLLSLLLPQIMCCPALSQRWTGPEVLDSPASPEAELRRTLRDFSMINRLVSGAMRLLRRELVPRMRRIETRPVSVLDIGSGGCDIARWLVRRCRREGVTVHITCLDSDPRAVAFGRAACAAIPEIDVKLGNAFDLEAVTDPVDYIISNHFLHHIEEERIPCLLASMNRMARHGFIVSDLRRSYCAFVGFALLAALLWPRGVTRHDGLMSIRKALTRDELTGLVGRARLSGNTRVWANFPARLGVSCFR